MGKTYTVLLKLVPVVYLLYIISTTFSMAGMETFGWVGIFLILTIGIYEYVKFKKIIWVKHPINNYVVLLILVFAFTILTSPEANDNNISKTYFLGRIRNFIFIPYNLIILNRFFDYKRVIKTLLYILPLVGIYALLQKFTGFDPIKNIWSIKWNIKNIQNTREVFNMYLTYINIFQFHFFVLISFMIMGNISKKFKFILLMLSLIFLISFVFSGSRAIIGGVLVGLLAQTFYAYNRRIIFISIIVFSILASILAINTSPFINLKYNKTKNSISEMGDEIRYYLWKNHLLMFLDNPIKGVGYEMNEPLSKVYQKKHNVPVPKNFGGHSHNLIIQLLSGTGVLGTVFFLLFWIYIFFMLIKNINFFKFTDNNYDLCLSHGLFGGMVSFWFNGMTQWNFGDFEVTHNLFLFISIISFLYMSKAKRNLNENTKI